MLLSKLWCELCMNSTVKSQSDSYFHRIALYKATCAYYLLRICAEIRLLDRSPPHRWRWGRRRSGVLRDAGAREFRRKSDTSGDAARYVSGHMRVQVRNGRHPTQPPNQHFPRQGKNPLKSVVPFFSVTTFLEFPQNPEMSVNSAKVREKAESRGKVVEFL